MTFSEFQLEATRTDAPSEQLNNNIDLHGLHMVMGMETEVGEIMDIYKKNLAYNKPIDEVNEKEEIGDLMWYIANHCTNKGWDMGEILQTNINKLKARFPEKFSTDKANNRDLDVERKILEDGHKQGQQG